MEKTPDGYDANGTWHSAAGLYEAGEPFLKLIDHPAITDVLTEIIGSHLRCESCYSFVRHRDCPPFEMHGGHRGGNRGADRVASRPPPSSASAARRRGGATRRTRHRA